MNKEQLYHNNRTTFVILHGHVHYGPKGLSHKDWLVGQNVMTEETYNQVVRGYFDETGIYFYQGDFETNDVVETTAVKYADFISKELPVYCGCIKGEVGEKWKPIKQIR